jgi:hypothetical protein
MQENSAFLKKKPAKNRYFPGIRAAIGWPLKRRWRQPLAAKFR